MANYELVVWISKRLYPSDAYALKILFQCRETQRQVTNSGWKETKTLALRSLAQDTRRKSHLSITMYLSETSVLTSDPLTSELILEKSFKYPNHEVL